MYKLMTRAKNSDDLSIGFDRDRRRRQQTLTSNKKLRSKYHVRIMLKAVFGFAEQQDKSTDGLGYKLILTRNEEDAVLNKAPGFDDARIKVGNIHWQVPHYTPSLPQQGLLCKQISSKTPTELRYIERCFFDRSN